MALLSPSLECLSFLCDSSNFSSPNCYVLAFLFFFRKKLGSTSFLFAPPSLAREDVAFPLRKSCFSFCEEQSSFLPLFFFGFIFRQKSTSFFLEHFQKRGRSSGHLSSLRLQYLILVFLTCCPSPRKAESLLGVQLVSYVALEVRRVFRSPPPSLKQKALSKLCGRN